jgi:hypothetical protein
LAAQSAAAAVAAMNSAVVPPPLPSSSSPPPLPEALQTTDTSPQAAPGDGLTEVDEAAGGRRVARRRPAGPSRNRIAANDDAPSIGGLIYALNQKPSNKPFLFAGIATGVWMLVGMVLAWMLIGPDLMAGKSFGEALTRTVLVSTIAAIVAPCAVFWLLALLAWRTEELKLRSTAMTEVAVRLAEPDRMAEQSIASLGQAVRRQVSFMNDAVARALGRAGELEALVHNEVNALERSYEDNERRIRGLIQELAGERNALLNTSERVADTLRGLGSEVPALIDKLSSQQVKLAGIIEGAGQNLTALETAIASQTGALENTLGDRTTHLQAVLQDYTAALGGALGQRSEEMQRLFDGYMQTLDTTIGGRTEVLQGVFEEYAKALDTTLAHRAQELDTQLVERTQALDDAFTDRLRIMDESILRSTMAIDGAVSEKAQLLTSAMESHARTLTDTLGKQAGDLDESLMNGIAAVRRTSESITRQSVKAIEGLASQSDLLKNVSESLLNQINGVTNRFENQGQAIMRAANALETANYKIDLTLQSRHAELSQTIDKISSKADDFGRVMQGYSSTIEGSLTEAESRARLLTDELARDAVARSRSTIEEVERMKSAAAAETDRALHDLKSRFSNVSQEMTSQIGTMASQFNEHTSAIRQQAQRTAAELEHEQARIKAQFDSLPATAREGADTMRRALNDQLKALEQLSSLTTREASRRDVAVPLESSPTGRAPTPLVPAAALAPRPATVSPTLAQSLAREMTARSQGGPVAQAQAEGWSFGDLLARASRDEDHAPASQQPAAPQQIPLDIALMARALDPATASAIWSRFRAGQRGFMVRSIYTAEGRTAFDEIGQRYRTSPDFQLSVNRYLTDFEHILRETEARDPSGRNVQNQLVSDMGRVYLFLAHMSGRLA